MSENAKINRRLDQIEALFWQNRKKQDALDKGLRKLDGLVGELRDTKEFLADIRPTGTLKARVDALQKQVAALTKSAVKKDAQD